jgi:hypothetical protein
MWGLELDRGRECVWRGGGGGSRGSSSGSGGGRRVRGSSAAAPSLARAPRLGLGGDDGKGQELREAGGRELLGGEARAGDAVRIEVVVVIYVLSAADAPLVLPGARARKRAAELDNGRLRRLASVCSPICVRDVPVPAVIVVGHGGKLDVALPTAGNVLLFGWTGALGGRREGLCADGLAPGGNRWVTPEAGRIFCLLGGREDAQVNLGGGEGAHDGSLGGRELVLGKRVCAGEDGEEVDACAEALEDAELGWGYVEAAVVVGGVWPFRVDRGSEVVGSRV